MCEVGIAVVAKIFWHFFNLLKTTVSLSHTVRFSISNSCHFNAFVSIIVNYVDSASVDTRRCPETQLTAGAGRYRYIPSYLPYIDIPPPRPPPASFAPLRRCCSTTGARFARPSSTANSLVLPISKKAVPTPLSPATQGFASRSMSASSIASRSSDTWNLE